MSGSHLPLKRASEAFAYPHSSRVCRGFVPVPTHRPTRQAHPQLRWLWRIACVVLLAALAEVALTVAGAMWPPSDRHVPLEGPLGFWEAGNALCTRIGYTHDTQIADKIRAAWRDGTALPLRTQSGSKRPSWAFPILSLGADDLGEHLYKGPVVLAEVAVGWPWRCVYARLENSTYEPFAPKGETAYDMDHGLLITSQGEFEHRPVAYIGGRVLTLGANHCQLVPLQPLWLPFCANVFVMSATVLLSRAFLACLRHGYRRRHGLCPICAYDLRATPPASPCPECGASRTPTPVPTPAKARTP